MTEKRPEGRPSLYKPEYCEAIVEHMKEGASITSFAAHVGVARSTIQYWEEQHPEFSVAVKRGKAVCAAWWEAVLRNNAKEGGGNATSTIFGLKNMAPEDWRDKVDLTSNDGPLKVVIQRFGGDE